MPSNRRAGPRQSGKTLPDRLLCAVICGDIHTRSDSSAQAMGFFPMPESVTGTNSRMIGGTQVERPLEDLPSLCRAKAAPTMRVIIGEPPAKDMGCNPAAAGCGDSRERLALAAWRQAAQARRLAKADRARGRSQRRLRIRHQLRQSPPLLRRNPHITRRLHRAAQGQMCGPPRNELP